MSDNRPPASTPTAPQRPRSRGESDSSNGTSPARSDGTSAEEPQNASNAEQPRQRPTTKSSVPTAGSVAQRADDQQTSTSQPGASRSTAAPGSAVPVKSEAPVQKAAKPGVDVRKARLKMVRVDPWSVMKLAFALSIAIAIVTVVAVTIVWAVLGAAGVWDAINSSVATVLSDNASEFDITDYVGFGRIIGLTLIISAIDVVLITALATVGAFMYNLAASLLGGLEVTLAEDR